MMSPTANAAAVTAMAIRTTKSSMASPPPEEALRLELMVIASRTSVPPSRKNHAATGPCKATAIWEHVGILIAAKRGKAKAKSLSAALQKMGDFADDGGNERLRDDQSGGEHQRVAYDTDYEVLTEEGGVERTRPAQA